MNKKISEIIEKREITRLCHFTKSKNLPTIFVNDTGVLASEFIEKDIFDPNDILRLDGKMQHINCSIQYPNIYYFSKIYKNDPKFKEWVILFINPYIMEKENTKFCQVNAAKGNGKYIKTGIDAFEEIFDDKVDIIFRTNYMKPNIPTNLQAEVLIYEKIPIKYIEAIVVPNEEQAEREYVRLKETLQLQIPAIYIIPELFDKQLGQNLRKGNIPQETIYERR